MARAIVNISIPESMKAFVEMRAERGYASVSDYFRELIRRDEKRYLKRLDEFGSSSSYPRGTVLQDRRLELEDDYQD